MTMESVAIRQVMRSIRGPQNPRPVGADTVRRIGRFARPHARRLTVFILLSIVGAAFTVATPVLAGRVIDAIVAGGPRRTVIALAVTIAGIALLEGAVRIVTRWYSAHIGEGLIYDLRVAVFDHVQRMPIAFFLRTRTGALVSRLNNDVVGAQRAFSDTLSNVVGNLVTLALTLAVMVRVSWTITLAALLLLPVFMVPSRHLGRRLAELRREAADHDAAMSTRMTERFSAAGATLIKLYGTPDRENTEFALRADRVRAIGVRSALLQTTFMTALTLVSALALAVVYGVGGLQALAGQIEAGQIVTMALLLTRLYAPLTALANARVEVMGALVSFDRVFEVLDLTPGITDPPKPTPLPDGPLEVRLDGVRFGYPSAAAVSLASLEEVAVLDSRGGEEVLHGIDLLAAPGQTIALVGSSGAGKSTISQLVPRLYDVDAGAVRIGGVDVRELASADLRRAVGVVTQDGHLFHETVRENLRLADADADETALWEALRAAHLDATVRALPDGLDTVVGDRGYRLSGGERQRLTIARLLLAQPRVVVLDEATAHLDSTSEAAVQQALTAALADRTAIVIAHRLSTIRSADRILVVEDGRIAESGSHDELLACGGRYAELYRTQFAPADPE